MLDIIRLSCLFTAGTVVLAINPICLEEPYIQYAGLAHDPGLAPFGYYACRARLGSTAPRIIVRQHHGWGGGGDHDNGGFPPGQPGWALGQLCGRPEDDGSPGTIETACSCWFPPKTATSYFPVASIPMTIEPVATTIVSSTIRSTLAKYSRAHRSSHRPSPTRPVASTMSLITVHATSQKHVRATFTSKATEGRHISTIVRQSTSLRSSIMTRRTSSTSSKGLGVLSHPGEPETTADYVSLTISPTRARHSEVNTQASQSRSSLRGSVIFENTTSTSMRASHTLFFTGIQARTSGKAKSSAEMSGIRPSSSDVKRLSTRTFITAVSPAVSPQVIATSTNTSVFVANTTRFEFSSPCSSSVISATKPLSTAMHDRSTTTSSKNIKSGTVRTGLPTTSPTHRSKNTTTIHGESQSFSSKSPVESILSPISKGGDETTFETAMRSTGVHNFESATRSFALTSSGETLETRTEGATSTVITREGTNNISTSVSHSPFTGSETEISATLVTFQSLASTLLSVNTTLTTVSDVIASSRTKTSRHTKSDVLSKVTTSNFHSVEIGSAASTTEIWTVERTSLSRSPRSPTSAKLEMQTTGPTSSLTAQASVDDRSATKTIIQGSVTFNNLHSTAPSGVTTQSTSAITRGRDTATMITLPSVALSLSRSSDVVKTRYTDSNHTGSTTKTTMLFSMPQGAKFTLTGVANPSLRATSVIQIPETSFETEITSYTPSTSAYDSIIFSTVDASTRPTMHAPNSGSSTKYQAHISASGEKRTSRSHNGSMAFVQSTSVNIDDSLTFGLATTSHLLFAESLSSQTTTSGLTKIAQTRLQTLPTMVSTSVVLRSQSELAGPNSMSHTTAVSTVSNSAQTIVMPTTRSTTSTSLQSLESIAFSTGSITTASVYSLYSGGASPTLHKKTPLRSSISSGFLTSYISINQSAFPSQSTHWTSEPSTYLSTSHTNVTTAALSFGGQSDSAIVLPTALQSSSGPIRTREDTTGLVNSLAKTSLRQTGSSFIETSSFSTTSLAGSPSPPRSLYHLNTSMPIATSTETLTIASFESHTSLSTAMYGSETSARKFAMTSISLIRDASSQNSPSILPIDATSSQSGSLSISSSVTGMLQGKSLSTEILIVSTTSPPSRSMEKSTTQQSTRYPASSKGAAISQIPPSTTLLSLQSAPGYNSLSVETFPASSPTRSSTQSASGYHGPSVPTVPTSSSAQVLQQSVPGYNSLSVEVFLTSSSTQVLLKSASGYNSLSVQTFPTSSSAQVLQESAPGYNSLSVEAFPTPFSTYVPQQGAPTSFSAYAPQQSAPGYNNLSIEEFPPPSSTRSQLQSELGSNSLSVQKFGPSSSTELPLQSAPGYNSLSVEVFQTSLSAHLPQQTAPGYNSLSVEDFPTSFSIYVPQWSAPTSSSAYAPQQSVPGYNNLSVEAFPTSPSTQVLHQSAPGYNNLSVEHFSPLPSIQSHLQSAPGYNSLSVEVFPTSSSAYTAQQSPPGYNSLSVEEFPPPSSTRPPHQSAPGYNNFSVEQFSPSSATQSSLQSAPGRV